jgi:hypothetical protein
LIIDFADRADIRAKLPAAEGRLADLEAALREQSEEVEDWREYVAVLRRRAELGSSSVPAAKVAEAPSLSSSDLPPLDLVVEVVNRENRKIRSKDVAAILRSEGHVMTNMAVSNALFYGAKRAERPRVRAALGRGFYAPLSFKEASEVGSARVEFFVDESHPSDHLGDGASNGDGPEPNLDREAVNAPSGEGTGPDPGGST